MHANANTCKDYRFNVPLICSDVYWRCRFQSPTDLLFRFVSSEPPAMCAHWWLITQHMKESGDALWHPRIAEQPAGNWSLLVRPLRAGGSGCIMPRSLLWDLTGIGCFLAVSSGLWGCKSSIHQQLLSFQNTHAYKLQNAGIHWSI